MPTAREETSPATIARGYFEAVAQRDVNAMASFWEPGALDVIHGVAEMRVPDDLRTWFDNLFTSFPDFRFEILDVIAEGEKTAVHWHATGTFNGTTRFEGLDPNGARVDIQGCDVLTIRNGRIQHNDAYMNGTDMARQLEALPPSGSLQERVLFGVVNLKTRLAKLLRR